jgi:hypothetical protein
MSAKNPGIASEPLYRDDTTPETGRGRIAHTERNQREASTDSDKVVLDNHQDDGDHDEDKHDNSWNHQPRASSVGFDRLRWRVVVGFQLRMITHHGLVGSRAGVTSGGVRHGMVLSVMMATVSSPIIRGDRCPCPSPLRPRRRPDRPHALEYQQERRLETQFYGRAVDMKTGEETVTERVWLERVADDYAWKWAEDFYGGDDVTWIEDAGPGTLRVGRILEDGTRSEPLVTITVEEVDTDENTPEFT